MAPTLRKIIGLKIVNRIKYYLRKPEGKKIEGITVDELAKEDFKKMMQWNEKQWKLHTIKVITKEQVPKNV